jgi:hypothetical protein
MLYPTVCQKKSHIIKIDLIYIWILYNWPNIIVPNVLYIYIMSIGLTDFIWIYYIIWLYQWFHKTQSTDWPIRIIHQLVHIPFYTIQQGCGCSFLMAFTRYSNSTIWWVVIITISAIKPLRSVQGGALWIAKLVNRTWISLWFIVLITIVNVGLK